MNLKQLTVLFLLVSFGLSQDSEPDAVISQAMEELNQYYANAHQELVNQTNELADMFAVLNATGAMNQSDWDNAAHRIFTKQAPNARWTVVEGALSGAQQWTFIGPPHNSASSRASSSGQRTSYTIHYQTATTTGLIGNSDSHYLNGADDDDRFSSTLTNTVFETYQVPRRGLLQVHIQLTAGNTRAVISNNDEFGFSSCAINLVNRGDLRAGGASVSIPLWSQSTTNDDARINVRPIAAGTRREFTLTSSFFVQPGQISISYTNYHSRSVFVNDVTTSSTMTADWRVTELWARIQ